MQLLRSGAVALLIMAAGVSMAQADPCVVYSGNQPEAGDLPAWDTANPAEGFKGCSEPDTNGGDYIFQVGVQNPEHGAWRTVLNVTSGEAHLYIERGDPTVQDIAPSPYFYSSSRAGSDGIVLYTSQFSAGQAWYIRVNATPGSTWNLVTGDIEVTDLGPVTAATATTTATVGPEGMVWLRSEIDPASTDAWGIISDNESAQGMYVSRGSAPVIFNNGKFYQQKAESTNQMLAAVDPVKGFYYLGVKADPDNTVQLRTFRHNAIVPSSLPTTQYTDLGIDNFDFSLKGQSSALLNAGHSDFRYVTYKVNVPVDAGLGWQVKMDPLNDADIDLYVRQGMAATLDDNSALSAIKGGVTDNTVLVPPILTGGKSFITVYSPIASDFSFTLKSGNPDIETRPFINEGTGRIINSLPENQKLGGWIYYRVDNIPEQLLYQGWYMSLANQVLQTRIAIRRNALPVSGTYREAGAGKAFNFEEIVSNSGYLLQPNHEADVWYIGVYTDKALGNFELTTSAPVRSELAFNNKSESVGYSGATCTASQAQDLNTVRYFKVTVPAGALGWDVRLSNITGNATSSQQIRMAISRDAFPGDMKPEESIAGKATWDSGQTWGVINDYSARLNADNSNNAGRVFTAGIGSPLVPGVYYIGVGLTTTGVANTPRVAGHVCYTLTSKGIGIGNDAVSGQPYPIQVQDLAFNGSVTNTLPARDIAVYRIAVPANTPGWELKLLLDSNHEGVLAVRRGAIPNINALPDAEVDSTQLNQGSSRKKVGNEYFYKFASRNKATATDDEFLQAGTYYAVVQSEGVSPASAAKLGTGSSRFTLSSAAMPYVDTTADPLNEDETKLWTAQSLKYGERKLYRVRAANGLSAMEVRIKNSTGKPSILVERANEGVFRFPEEGDDKELVYFTMGNSGYERDFYHQNLITIPNPSGDYWVMVGSENQTTPQLDLTYDLEITGTATPRLGFNGGVAAVTPDAPQLANTWRYYKVVVPAGALGWHLSLDDVSSGMPRMVIRRDDAGAGFVTPFDFKNIGNLKLGTTWPDLNQWYVDDHFGSDRNSENLLVNGRYFTVGMNAPLVPGTYYVGVSNLPITTPKTTDNMAYTIKSKGIGNEGTFDGDLKEWKIPVKTLTFSGGTDSGSLEEHEIAVYKVVVPAATRSFELLMKPETANDDALMAVAFNRIPHAEASETKQTTSVGGTLRDKTGAEYFYSLLPTVDGALATGNYYFLVMGQGQNRASHGHTGAGAAKFTITSKGELNTQELAYVDNTIPVADKTSQYGQLRTYRITVPDGTQTMCVRVSGDSGFWFSRVPTGSIGLAADGAPTEMPYRTAIEGGTVRYGGYYGPNTTAVITHEDGQDYFMSVSQPKEDEPFNSPDTYDIVFDCSPIPKLAFNGGYFDDQIAASTLSSSGFNWYQIDVPEGAVGWDLRLINIARTTENSGEGKESRVGSPRLVIRRGIKPVSLTHGMQPDSIDWPVGVSWVVNTDFMVNASDSDPLNTNIPSDGRFFTAGMGAPLVPGTYFIGVYNNDKVYPARYRIYSRGIGNPGTSDANGNPWLIPIRTLAMGSSTSGSIPPTPDRDSRCGGLQCIPAPGTGFDPNEAYDDVRDYDVYRITVPEGVTAWDLRVTPQTGSEAILAVRHGNLPNIMAGINLAGIKGKATDPVELQGTTRRQIGKEYYYLFGNTDPVTGENRQTVPPGDYYALVVSQGQNPNGTKLGQGTVGYTISNKQMVFNDKISTPVAPTVTPKWTKESVDHGELKMYRVRVPAGGLEAMEILIKNQTGYPSMMVKRTGSGVFNLPNESSSNDSVLRYNQAADGGYLLDSNDKQVITIPNAQAGDYWIAVGSSGDTRVASTFTSIQYDLQVSSLTPKVLAFDGGQDTDLLVTKQIRYYKVVVPDTVDGKPVKGWQVSSTVSSGSISMRARKDALPNNDKTVKSVVLSLHNEIVVAPPVLTPGTWYVEVQAIDEEVSSGYTITSKPVRPARDWTMPIVPADFTHPGLTSPTFGDTGIDSSGKAIINPSSGDQGTDLKAGHMHFYKVVVPPNNAGLLHTKLTVFGGDDKVQPQMYIRLNSAPTLDHNLAGDVNTGVTLSKTTYDRFDEDTGSSYGHWVALDSRVSTQLETGEWWIGVFAKGGNVRYRLQVEAGAVQSVAGVLADVQGYMQDLSSDPAVTTTYNKQTLLKGDVRYYRMRLPQSSVVNSASTPTSWTVTLSGNNNIGMRIRDTAPPGYRNTVAESIADDANWQDWKDENELTGVNSHGYLASGQVTKTYTIPELKPGATYYLAVRAVEDIPLADPYTITSTLGDKPVGTTRLQLDGVLDFFTGRVGDFTDPLNPVPVMVPAGKSLLFRVDVPALAGAWHHTSTHNAAIQVYLQQGTVSPQAGTKIYNDWSSLSTAATGGFGNFPSLPSNGKQGYFTKVGADSLMDMSFFRAGSVTAQMPWLPGQSYYLTVKNSATGALPFTLSMAGEYLGESDADGDGLPDLWEVENFGDTSRGPTTDSDKDGMTDLQEMLAGTDPNNPDSDDDGVADGADAFPLDPAETEDKDKDGIGDNADLDDDADGVPDLVDNCPNLANTSQVDTNKDGIGNACQTTLISFEAGMPVGWTPGSPGWTVVSDQASDQVQSLRTMPATHGQTATISWKESFATGNLLFDVKVSSETNKDIFKLNVDGVDVTASKKSGEVNWVKVTVPIKAGVHTLVWNYTKDAANSAGSDAVWIDNIRYTQGDDAGDTDGDGMLDFDDLDDDNDGVPDTEDDLPKNPDETVDTDKDGIGNNTDNDDDGDGFPDDADPFPEDPTLFNILEGAKANQGTGSAVAFAGDVDKDGFGDIVVGAYRSSPLSGGKPLKLAGSIQVISGKTNTLIPALTVAGSRPGDAFGFSVSAAGDVNSDGFADIAVGAPGSDCGNKKDAGSLTVLSGATGSALYTVCGALTKDRLGTAVALVADLDGDGKQDLVAGAPLADGPGGKAGKDLGSIRVFSAVNGKPLAERFGQEAKDSFGASLAAAGDVDKDGYGDVIVGAPLADKVIEVEVKGVPKSVKVKDVGHVQLISGFALLNNTNETMIPPLEGENPKDGFGRTVAGNADVDGDGKLDIVVGAPGLDDITVKGTTKTVRKDVGRIYVVDAGTGDSIFNLDGKDIGDQLGSAIALAGDLNRDGGAELIAGIAKADTTNVVTTKTGEKTVIAKDAGRLIGYSGLNGKELFAIPGLAAGDYYGWAVDVSGDVNGDGVKDVIVSAWGDDIPTTNSKGKTVQVKNAGRVEVMSGKGILNK